MNPVILGLRLLMISAALSAILAGLCIVGIVMSIFSWIFGLKVSLSEIVTLVTSTIIFSCIYMGIIQWIIYIQ
jgi:hypothetical protein